MRSHLALIAAVLLCPALAATQDLKSYIPRLERNLNENILKFWHPSTIDQANGGYIINHDASGKPNPAGSKGIVTQSRQVWLFSRLAREGYRSPEMLKAAEHGFAFLRDKMWDKKNGGFYWEVDAAGAKAIRPQKHMYGESFGLYALSEFYLASKNKEALKLAGDLFRLMETKAYDTTYGGYRESFNEDWSPMSAGQQGPMGPAELKLMNTHLHLMEAFSVYHRAAPSELVRRRLTELLNIQSNTVVRKKVTACTDKYDANWTPRLDGNYGRVSYGHDIENVWLIVDAADSLGVSPHPFVDLFRDLWDYSLKFGYDAAAGGFYDDGPLNAAADRRAKTWWVQAEAIVSALYMYKLTGDTKYADVFRKTYDFIDKQLTDWTTGEWHTNVSPEGKPGGSKANIWKAGYHNGRAMIECLRLLRDLEKNPPAQPAPAKTAAR